VIIGSILAFVGFADAFGRRIINFICARSIFIVFWSSLITSSACFFAGCGKEEERRKIRLKNARKRFFV
jgi:hypothetical protein